MTLFSSGSGRYFKSLKFALPIVLAFSASPARAVDIQALLSDYRTAVAQGKKTHVVDIDNDSLLLQRDDGFYTSGLRYTRHYSLREANSVKMSGWRIGQELYTASDIKLPPSQIGPPDHPYAAWLYGGFFNEAHQADGSRMKIGLDIGCLGPCAGGKWTQDNLHKILDQPLPQGWSKQVKNEFGAVLYGEAAMPRWQWGSSVDLTPSIHGRIGNIFTDAGAGLLLRIGKLNLLPGQPTWHGFVRVDGRAVAYNASLQGGYFSKGNLHTVKPKRLVGEVEAGMAWISGPYGINLSIIRRGNEIRGLSSNAGSQNFARLSLTYTP